MAVVLLACVAGVGALSLVRLGTHGHRRRSGPSARASAAVFGLQARASPPSPVRKKRIHPFACGVCSCRVLALQLDPSQYMYDVAMALVWCVPLSLMSAPFVVQQSAVQSYFVVQSAVGRCYQEVLRRACGCRVSRSNVFGSSLMCFSCMM